MDVFAHLLHDVRADGALFGRTIMEPPWAVRIEDGTALTLVTTLRGSAWIQPDDGPPTELDEGACAIVSAGPFSITDSPAAPPSPLFVVQPHHRCVTPDGEPIDDYTLGTRTCGETFEGPNAILTGAYQVRGRTSDRLTRLLPRVLVVSESAELRALLDLTVAEVQREAPGQQAVLDRLLDLILVSTLREWFARPEARSPRWYRAMSDEVIGRALRLMHEEPERAWTVASLADQCAVSRATFARRFTELVGQTPMAYLAEWRLSLAVDLLLTTDLGLDAVAHQVGYGSGFGLSVAFKRVHGTRPSDYRAA